MLFCCTFFVKRKKKYCAALLYSLLRPRTMLLSLEVQIRNQFTNIVKKKTKNLTASMRSRKCHMFMSLNNSGKLKSVKIRKLQNRSIASYEIYISDNFQQILVMYMSKTQLYLSKTNLLKFSNFNLSAFDIAKAILRENNSRYHPSGQKCPGTC